MMKYANWIPRRLAVTFWLLAVTGPCTAQDIPRWELFGGYSIDQTDTRAYFKSSTTIYSSKTLNVTLPGWNATFTENLNKWFGGSLDVSGFYKTVMLQGIGTRQMQYSLLYGPRFFRRTKWFTPFAHILAGTAYGSAAVKPVGPHDSGWAFALAAGGGLDLNLGKSLAIRLVKAEYFRTNLFGINMNSFRGSAGLVFTLGSR